MKTLIGFANADGGILVIGVEDDGRITGFNHSKAHRIESFQQIDRELVSTPIVKRFDIIPVTNDVGESDNILIICVDPSVNRVIVAPNDVVYLRQGDETIELSYERRRMLEYDRGQRYVEDELVLDATLEDIDEDLIEKAVLSNETNDISIILRTASYEEQLLCELNVLESLIINKGNAIVLLYNYAYDGSVESSDYLNFITSVDYR